MVLVSISSMDAFVMEILHVSCAWQAFSMQSRHAGCAGGHAGCGRVMHCASVKEALMYDWTAQC